ncbi:Phosphatidylinositol 4-kinase pik1alpha (PI4-kinase)(PtdIns-4-kinase) [Coemansia sp. RSA 1200]|nr:Phosphatidylinositol 4-kinase pik1alpha (PI4-kinase)(PtdIns-4-kinase) [Coemansia sp. RSA 1200]
MTQSPRNVHGNDETSVATEVPEPRETQVQQVDSTANSSLLLRLFTSQFFDCWLAVSYLFRYPNIVGVQHYLCNELRKFPLEDVEFFLPQLVHILVTRPNESTALESVLLDMCLQSSHVSIALYWYLQAYLADQSANPRTTLFKHCQRIFNQVQELLFTDITPELIIDSPEPVQHAYLYAMNNINSAIPPPSHSDSLVTRFKRMFRLAPQIRENSHAAIVGIGSTFASLGSPSLAPAMGWVAVAEGKGLKLSDTTSNDTDIALPHRSLSLRPRDAGSPSLGRSRSMIRNRTAHSLKARNGRHGLDSEPAHSAPETEHHDPISIRYGLDQRNDEEDDIQSQPATPLQRSYEVSSPFSAYSASPHDTNEREQLSAVTLDLPQQSIAIHRPSSPAERISTESCHSVAVMESLRSANPASAGTEFSEEIDNTGVHAHDDIADNAAETDRDSGWSRKSYLTKATKQFQRNAKAFDRRMGQSFDDANTQSMRARSHIWSRDYGSSAAASNRRTTNSRYTEIQADLDEMSVYMERERHKLERRSNYFGAEIRFMTSLMDISQRVCAVAKAGRQQFLKAELTLLNHSLDKNTCIPLWCPETDRQRHHRIVRIPTEDTVVLNSAERAPYLLTLEVLEPDESTNLQNRCIGGLAGEPTPDTKEFGLEGADTPQVNVSAQFQPGDVRNSSIVVGNDGFDAEHSDKPRITEQDKAQVVATSSPENVQDAGSVTASVSSLGESSEASHDVENPRPKSAKEPEQDPKQQSPSVVEDVDEKLMAEVFGDIDDISDVPEPPFSPMTSRRHSSSFGRARATNSPAKRRDPLDENNGSSIVTDASKTSSTPLDAKAQQSSKHLNSHLPTQQHKGDMETLKQHASKGGAPLSRIPVSQDEIRARMRTASVLLAQLARQQKALGIKVNKLFIPQMPDDMQGDGAKAKNDPSETLKRRSKLNNATAQALAMEEIREKLIREMMQLEELRLKQPGLDSLSGSTAAHSQAHGADEPNGIGTDDDMDMHQVEFKDDPSAKVLKEDWDSKKARIRRTSPYGRYKNWNLLSVIVKEGSDLRQEQLALQLIREMQRIWQREHVDVFVQYYRIIVTGEGCGLMETITNTVSVHSIKKEFYSRNPGYAGPPYTLYNYFVTTFGTPDTERFRVAQDCFMRSLASYSLITYVLQIRDRHNGNILLDTEGHAIHIDFGFMLSNSPGSVGFEQAPFKFPMEYVDILGGRDSAKFAEFRGLLVSAFLALRRHAENICLLVEIMLKGSPLPCLSGGVATVNTLRDRFHLALSEQQIEELVDSMLISSCDNMTTRMYDAFQYYSNGIL